MTVLRALIVDDEPLARRLLRSMLSKEPDISLVAEAADGKEAAALIEDLNPDVVFLDVRMPIVNGFTMIESLGRERMPHVIFVTAYDRYALQAFSVNAVDYLLKPFDAERLHEAVQRVVNRSDSRPMPGQVSRLLEAIAKAAGSRTYPERIPLRLEDRIQLVATSEIDRLEAAGKYVTVHTGGVVHVVRETMADLEALLDPARFVRVHRSHVVNLARVKTVHPYFRGEHVLTLWDGTRIKTGRGYRHRLANVLRPST